MTAKTQKIIRLMQTTKSSNEKAKNSRRRHRIMTVAETGIKARGIGFVDVAVGFGNVMMPVEQIARGLAKIARKGIRVGVIREIAGIPTVATTAIPAGMIVMRAPNGIEARRIGGPVVVTVEYSAIGAPGAVDAPVTAAA